MTQDALDNRIVHSEPVEIRCQSPPKGMPAGPGDISLERQALDDLDYHAIPRNVSLRSLATGPNFLTTLLSIVERFIATNFEREFSKLFWALTLLDENIVQILEGYLNENSESKFTAVIQLLQDAPHEIAFNFPAFARKLLETGERLGLKYKNAAMGSLVVNCQPGAFVGGAQSPALTRIRDKAESLIKEHKADPLLYPLYSDVKKFISNMIASLETSEADMRFEHS